MTSPILVTGGTGTLGRHVTPLLADAGVPVRVLGRGNRPRNAADGVEFATGDLLANTGIEPALDGVDVVLHLAGGPKGDDEATGNLVAAASRAGVRHLVHISVIGADRMPIGYFRAKHGAERAVIESGIPWTILRASQFHDLVLTVAESMARLPVVPAPRGLRFQPVDSREVAARLVELTLAEPAGRVRDLAGPAVYELAELMRGYLHERGIRRPILPVRLPGKAGVAYRAGDNLSLRHADHGTRTWEHFLSGQPAGFPSRRSR